MSRWPEKKLKFVAGAPIINGVGEAAEFDDPSWPRYIRITDIDTPRSLRVDTFKSLPPQLARHADVQRGDLLLAAVGATFGKGYLHTNDSRACYAGYLVRVRPGSEMDPGFLSFWSESQHYWDQTRSRVVQATIQNFSAGKYRQLTVPCPPLSTQQALAAFLDRKTAAIDELIKKKERLINLLQEKRQALITQAVTKGLDPNVPMKESGFPLIPTLPKHWFLWTVRNLIRTGNLTLQDGNHGELHPVAAEYVDSGIPFLMANNIRNGRVDLSDCKFLPQARTDALRIGFANAGDVLLTHKGTVGEVAVLPDELTVPYVMLTPQVTYYRPAGQAIRRHFVALAMQARPFREELAWLAGQQSTRDYVGITAQRQLHLPLPPAQEQEAIASSLRPALMKLDQAGEGVGQQLRLLLEYRQALIAAAVTGQIDVSKEAA